MKRSSSRVENQINETLARIRVIKRKLNEKERKGGNRLWKRRLMESGRERFSLLRLMKHSRKLNESKSVARRFAILHPKKGVGRLASIDSKGALVEWVKPKSKDQARYTFVDRTTAPMYIVETLDIDDRKPAGSRSPSPLSDRDQTIIDAASTNDDILVVPDPTDVWDKLEPGEAKEVAAAYGLDECDCGCDDSDRELLLDESDDDPEYDLNDIYSIYGDDIMPDEEDMIPLDDEDLEEDDLEEDDVSYLDDEYDIDFGVEDGEDTVEDVYDQLQRLQEMFRS